MRSIRFTMMRPRWAAAFCTGLLVTGGFLAALPAAQASATTAVGWPTTWPIDQLGTAGEATAASPDTFAGVTYDSAHHRLSFYVAPASVDARETALFRLTLARANMNGASSQASVRYVHAPRSGTQLQSIMDTVTASQVWLARHGATLNTWYPDPAAGKVVAGFSILTPGLVRLVARRFADQVAVIHADEFTEAVRDSRVRGFAKAVHIRGKAGAVALTSSAPAPTRLLDSQPYYGGDRIYFIYSAPDGLHIRQCTGNFEFRNGGGTAEMGSAGHCSGNGQGWTQGYQDSQGMVHNTGPMGTTAVSSFANGEVDAQVMYGRTYAPYVYTSTTQSETVAGITVPVTGATVCADGAFTGQNCKGKVSTVNGCFTESEKGLPAVTYCHAAAAISTDGSRMAQAGDSGGPVYTNNGTAIRAEGVIDSISSTGQAVQFSMINYVQTTLAATVYH